MLDGFQLHAVSKGPLAGQQALPLQIAVHHDDGGLVVVQVPDNDRHGLPSRQFAGPTPPVAGDQLIAAIGVRPGDGRHQHTVLPDTLRCFQHGLIIPDLKGMVFKRV